MIDGNWKMKLLQIPFPNSLAKFSLRHLCCNITAVFTDSIFPEITKMKKLFLQLALGLCLSAFAYPALAQAPGYADPVLGRWDITVQAADGTTYPSWLEV